MQHAVHRLSLRTNLSTRANTYLASESQLLFTTLPLAQEGGHQFHSTREDRKPSEAWVTAQGGRDDVGMHSYWWSVDGEGLDSGQFKNFLFTSNVTLFTNHKIREHTDFGQLNEKQVGTRWTWVLKNDVVKLSDDLRWWPFLKQHVLVGRLDCWCSRCSWWGW